MRQECQPGFRAERSNPKHASPDFKPSVRIAPQIGPPSMPSCPTLLISASSSLARFADKLASMYFLECCTSHCKCNIYLLLVQVSSSLRRTTLALNSTYYPHLCDSDILFFSKMLVVSSQRAVFASELQILPSTHHLQFGGVALTLI